MTKRRPQIQLVQLGLALRKILTTASACSVHTLYCTLKLRHDSLKGQSGVVTMLPTLSASQRGLAAKTKVGVADHVWACRSFATERDKRFQKKKRISSSVHRSEDQLGTLLFLILSEQTSFGHGRFGLSIGTRQKSEKKEMRKAFHFHRPSTAQILV